MVSQQAIQAAQIGVAALFDRHVHTAGERPAIESARLSLSYSQLDLRSRRLASLLHADGVRPGDRICILSENDPDFLVLSVAALRLGATVATPNPRLAVAELAH